MKLPSKEQLLKASSQTIPDLLAPELIVLFVGINPGLFTAYSGFPYAHPANRFLPTLYAAGFTPRLLKPSEYTEMLNYGYGMTNLVERASTSAKELIKPEYRAGGVVLVQKILTYKPKWVAFVGIQAYRLAFERPKAQIGKQSELIGNSHIWVLPSPSGLNAHYRPADFIRVFKDFKNALNASTFNNSK